MTRSGQRTVPWVTLWSAEQTPVEEIVLYPGLDRVRYLDEHPSDWFMDVLWTRERIGKNGEPIFAQVHARRQRQCMLRPRCQVCGERLPTTNIPWLLPAGEFKGFANMDTVTTMTPPTCEPCQTVAWRLCPHLKREDVVRLSVHSVTPWGVHGDLYHPVQRIKDVRMAFDSEAMSHVIAKQLVVAFDGWTQQ